MEIHKFPYNWKLAEANFTKDKGKVFSCFACGGGSTMGYKLAGFDVIGCNEIDPKVNQVYVTNHAPRFNFLGDIRELRERERERATARTLQLGYFGRLTPMFHFLLIWQPGKGLGQRKGVQRGANGTSS